MESYNIDDSNGINKTYRTNCTCHDSTLDVDTPLITLTPANNTVFEGRALNLTCNAIGSESVMYDWLFPNRANVTSNILQINNINRLDVENYGCTALSTISSKLLTAATTTTMTDIHH